MARRAAKCLTPKGVLALKKEGYYADGDAVGLYVQIAHRQKGGKLDKKNGITRSWVYRYTSPTVLNEKGKHRGKAKVRMMGFHLMPMPAPLDIDCAECGQTFHMVNFEGNCPQCGMVYGVTPCSAHDAANVKAAGVGF